MQVKRRLWLALLACAIGFVFYDLVTSIGDFFGEHRGVPFYRERPHLLAVCLLVAVGVSVGLHFLLKRFGRDHSRRQDR